MENARRQFLSNTLALGVSASVAPILLGCRQRQFAKVVVIGAGLAGLNCARILQEQGWEPIVLEASSEAGGRTRTSTINDININMGGIEIGDGYERFVSLSDSHGLKFYSPHHSDKGLSIFQDGQLINATDWAEFAGNPLPLSIRATLPPRLQFDFHAQDFPLTSTTDWLHKKFAKYDIAESQLLRELGADQAAIDLINRAGNFNHIDQVSALHVLRAYAGLKFGKSKKTLRLSGGNQQLALALSREQQSLLTNHRVTRIKEQPNGIEIDCSNGSQWLTEHVVVAIPFSVLRKIELQVSLPAVQLEAIGQLMYTKISKLVCHVDQPFWENDGLPANMWCNSALERCFVSKSENGETLLSIFINGVGTDILDSKNDAQATQWILSELARTRPAIKGTLRPLAYVSWGNNPLSQGAYHAFAPGQVTRYAHAMVNPAGRVFFAGEHCARDAAGMEGALESGETTAHQLMNTS